MSYLIFLPLCWLPDSFSPSYLWQLLSRVQKVVFPPLLSPEHRGMNSPWNPEWEEGNNSAAAPAAASRSTAVAAVSVRETKREGVCESLSENEFLCTVPNVAELCRRVASCVFLFGSRALWWGRACRRERCGFIRSSIITEDQHPAMVSQSSMLRRETHCWHQRDWWWQHTHGLPCATAAPL